MTIQELSNEFLSARRREALSKALGGEANKSEAKRS